MELIVDPDNKGKRLDKFLVESSLNLSRSRLQYLIENHFIKINGQLCTSSDRLKGGEMVSIIIPEVVDPIPAPQSISLDVLYEDADVIVVNKPPGMVVHPAPGHAEGTLVNALLAHCGESLSGIGGVRRPGIVHRLDKGTSGLIVVAKNDFAHHHLASQFEHRSLSRTYNALVWGVPSPLEGRLETLIGREAHNRQKMGIKVGTGKVAITHYKILEGYGRLASRIECVLETGRTHQIRVHLTALKCSLIGDPLYGRMPRGLSSKISDPVKMITHGNQRPMLHAYALSFIHPRTSKLLKFTSSLPEDMETMIGFLKTVS